MRPNRIPVSFLRGVNLLDDPAALRDGEVVKAKNLWFQKPGVVAKRPALGFMQSFFQQAQASVGPIPQPRVLEFSFAPRGQGVTQIVAIQRTGGDDYMYLYPNVYYSPSYTGTPKSQVIGPSKTVPHFLEYGDKLYVFNGQSNGWVFDPQNIDAQGQLNFAALSWNDAAAVSVNPSLATVVRERVWYANLGAGMEDYMVVSDRFEPTTIAAAGVDPTLLGGRAFRVGKAGEGPITAIAELSATSAGTEASTMVAVWKNKRMFLITGEPLETDDIGSLLGDMDIIRINTEAGCVSQRTVVSTPLGVLWTGEDDVWCMPHGGQPVRVGTKIRPVLERQPAATQYLMHAVYDAGHYKLACQAEGGETGDGFPSPCSEHWWLDLRGGVKSPEESCWMGPQVYVQSGSDYPGTWNMKLDTRPNVPKQAVTLTSYYVGTGGDATVQDFTGVALCGMNSQYPFDVVAPFIPYREWQALTQYYYPDFIALAPAGSDSYPLMQTYVNTNPSTGVGNLTGATIPAFAPLADTLDGSVGWDGNFGSNALPPTLLEPTVKHQENAVLVDVVTKDMLGDPMLENVWEGVEVGYDASQPLVLRCTQMTDPEPVTRDIPFDNGGFVLDATALDTYLPGRRWKSRLIPPASDDRSPVHSVQLRLEEVAGILMVANWNTMTFTTDDPSRPDPFTITIGEAGTQYETCIELLEAIFDALYAELSLVGDFTYNVGSVFRFDSTWLYDLSPDMTDPSTSRILSIFGVPASIGAWLLGGGSTYGNPTLSVVQNGSLSLSGLNVLARTFKRRPK